MTPSQHFHCSGLFQVSLDKLELVELVCLYSFDTNSFLMCVWFIINADVREKCIFTQSATVVVRKLHI